MKMRQRIRSKQARAKHCVGNSFDRPGFYINGGRLKGQTSMWIGGVRVGEVPYISIRTGDNK